MVDLAMTPAEALRETARTLLAQTKARQAVWTPVATPRSEPPEYAYRLTLPGARVSISCVTPMILSDSITLRVQSAGGATASEWRVEAPPYDPDAGETAESVDVTGDWRLLRELFGEVHRHATGDDRVISTAEKALAELERNRPAGRS